MIQLLNDLESLGLIESIEIKYSALLCNCKICCEFQQADLSICQYSGYGEYIKKLCKSII